MNGVCEFCVITNYVRNDLSRFLYHTKDHLAIVFCACDSSSFVSDIRRVNLGLIIIIIVGGGNPFYLKF